MDLDKVGIVYNEKLANQKIKGVVPAHIVKLERDKPIKGGIPFNATVAIAPEAAAVQGVNADTGEEVSCENLCGMQIRLRGIWLNPNEPLRNRVYAKFQDAVLGEESPKDKEGNPELVYLKEENVYGKPILVAIDQVANRDNSGVFTNGTFAGVWEDGYELPPEEPKDEKLEDFLNAEG